MDEKISKLFLPLLEKLYNQDPAGEPFRKPVDVVKYGCVDYYHYVKHPIDLTTIRNRLENHEYQGDAWRFIADIQLLFANAYLFNRRGTPVYDYTNKLNKIWTNDSPNIMQKLNYCCGNSYKFGPQLLYCYGSTFEKYCQIAVGAKYRCYQDQYSFCLNCFSKIDSDLIDLQKLSSCETARVTTKKPVPKDDFKECTNDDWQYEVFIKCTQCSRRVHQICELYPARVNQIQDCVQQLKLEENQKQLSQVPTEELSRLSESNSTIPSFIDISSSASSSMLESSNLVDEHEETKNPETEESLTADIPCSDETKVNINQSEQNDNKISLSQQNPVSQYIKEKPLINQVSELAIQKSNNLDKDAPSVSHSLVKSHEITNEYRDKFVCNYCYRKKRIGFNLRHRKYSARRIPHTRMSRYIETKVNEYIKEHSPSAGEVTVRVLTAYRDNITVKPEMQEFINMSRDNGTQHPFLKDFPNEFNYTNRAIFAWQEIDGVDVCVFGMHVQEYGDDCPEPNRQVVYLSYLDSVHFFRPKSVRTAVYHEILLSYFKYVRRLGFKRIFIWVCPSRKGDDYIFYRHPSEQKMPTLRRLADWYINLLDKGIMSGIIDRHETLYQFFSNSGNNSILSMPYLNGDYWPGEFERLLKIMIESQRDYDIRFLERKEIDDRSSESTETSIYSNPSNLSSLKDEQGLFKPQSDPTCMDNQSGSIISREVLSMIMGKPSPLSNSPGFLELNGISFIDFQQESCPFTGGDSIRPDYDQPLDLSAKVSAEQSPAPFDLDISDLSSGNNNLNGTMNIASKKRKRRNTNSMGYTKKRNRTATQTGKQKLSSASFDATTFRRQNLKRSNLSRTCAQQQSKEFSGTPDVTLSPHDVLLRDLDKSLKRQRDGFMVARLSDCECSPHFESQRRQDETLFTCNLMKGREPFLQLARTKNYEFSTLRRAKFSSLAMVKHLGKTFKLEPLCHECFSFDSSKCHYACNECNDFYLCTSCFDHVDHDHKMILLEPTKQPDISDFLEDCSNSSSQSDSISSASSASSTISNKSFNDNSIDIPTNDIGNIKNNQKQYVNLSTNSSKATLEFKNPISSSPTTNANKPPLSCHNQRRHDLELVARLGDEENANLRSYDSTNKLANLPNVVQVPANQSTEIINHRSSDPTHLDINLVDNFIRQAEVAYDVDFDNLRDESKDLLSHYYTCSDRDTCYRCRFVILSCSFMSIVMRNSRLPMVMNSGAPQSATLAHSQSTTKNINNNINTNTNNNNNNNNAIGINLSNRHEFTQSQNHQHHLHQPRQK